MVGAEIQDCIPFETFTLRKWSFYLQPWLGLKSKSVFLLKLLPKNVVILFITIVGAEIRHCIPLETFTLESSHSIFSHGWG